MCGIAGVLSFNEPVDLAQLKNMTDILIHRGPDDEGHWLSDDKSIGLGHRRLSILDLSDWGKQPMHSLNNRYIITFNGEIYNHLELREKFPSDFAWTSNSDTETLIELIEKFGTVETLSLIRGMFAFAVYDFQKDIREGKDRFLLEMATGTGKTLTSSAIIKMFLRLYNVKRVLFLVDRIELETQAQKEFDEVLKNDFRTVVWKENQSDCRQIDILKIGDGSGEMDPGAWLLPYWMARYHGLLAPAGAATAAAAAAE